jgi:hypothetical protein
LRPVRVRGTIETVIEVPICGYGEHSRGPACRRGGGRFLGFWQGKTLKLIAELMEFRLQSVSLLPNLSVEFVSPRIRKEQHR